MRLCLCYKGCYGVLQGVTRGVMGCYTGCYGVLQRPTAWISAAMWCRLTRPLKSSLARNSCPSTSRPPPFDPCRPHPSGYNSASKSLHVSACLQGRSNLKAETVAGVLWYYNAEVLCYKAETMNSVRSRVRRKKKCSSPGCSLQVSDSGKLAYCAGSPQVTVLTA